MRIIINGLKYEKSYWVDTLKFARKGDAPKCCPPEKKFGRLYSWSDAMDSAGVWSPNGKGCGYGNTCVAVYPVRGICPEGWHLPKYKEFRILLDSAIWPAALHLKSTSGWNDYKGQSGNGSDDFGFSALPGGAGSYEAGHGPYHYGNLVFGGWGNFAEFWTSTEENEYEVHNVWVASNQQTYTFGANKRDALSIRCVQDY